MSCSVPMYSTSVASLRRISRDPLGIVRAIEIHFSQPESLRPRSPTLKVVATRAAEGLIMDPASKVYCHTGVAQYIRRQIPRENWRTRALALDLRKRQCVTAKAELAIVGRMCKFCLLCNIEETTIWSLSQYE